MTRNYFLKLFVFISLFSVKLGAQTDIKFLTFNVWQEGTSVPNGLTKIRDIILKTNPDIIGFTEVRNYNNEDWTTKIVDQLSSSGRKYYRGYAGGDISLISKYPILSSTLTGAGAVGAFDININSNTITVAVAHLDYTEYACYLPRGYNGGTLDWNMIDDGTGNPKPVTDEKTILDYNLTSSRDEQIQEFLTYSTSKHNPFILMGDFNEPSCLDWIANTASMFDHNGVTLEWQTTKNIGKYGFIDVYRQFFPDAVSNPGITWPSYAHEKGSTSWTPKSDERDRIDFIFFRKDGGIQIKNAALVGPKASYAKNVSTTTYTSKEMFIADSLPWPSDHKAVFATLTFPYVISCICAPPRDPGLIIYPNPSKGQFIIDLGATYNDIDVSIRDVIGRIVQTFTTTKSYSFPIEINSAPGIYFITVSYDGDKSVLRVVKE